MKAIVTTSASPFHYGHFDLYQKAVSIFGLDGVKVVIGKNVNKNINFEQILYHLAPYKIKYEITQNITLADYCRNYQINYIIRGVRNAVDVEYELKLSFLNREINGELDTIFFPTQHVFSNISSSTINELLKYRKFDVVQKYMNVDAMYRFYTKKPKFIVFYGKSCIGKSYYLNRIFNGRDIADSDKILWKVFEKIHGVSKTEEIRQKSSELIYHGENIADLIKIYSTGEFWAEFFDFVEKNFGSCDASQYIELKDENKVYIVDFASLGAYWNTIPSYLRGSLYLVKLENNDENRRKFIIKKGFEDKIDYLDHNYSEPDYFDMSENIGSRER
jgi:pantetheine-phosphate adenylyltransferase